MRVRGWVSLGAWVGSNTSPHTVPAILYTAQSAHNCLAYGTRGMEAMALLCRHSPRERVVPLAGPPIRIFYFSRNCALPGLPSPSTARLPKRQAPVCCQRAQQIAVWVYCDACWLPFCHLRRRDKLRCGKPEAIHVLVLPEGIHEVALHADGPKWAHA